MTKYELDENSWIIQDILPKLSYEFENLWSLHPAEYGRIKIFDRIINTPRWQQSYGQSYWFSGLLHEALELPLQFEPFLEWANLLDYGIFNQIVINWYENGNHYIGAHTDNEFQIKEASAILSISLGEERTFRIRSKSDKKIILDIPMINESYIVMGGNIQKNYTHEVPKITGHKGEQIGKRINITFRSFK